LKIVNNITINDDNTPKLNTIEDECVYDKDIIKGEYESGIDNIKNKYSSGIDNTCVPNTYMFNLDQVILPKVNIRNEPVIDINNINDVTYQKYVDWYRGEYDRLETMRVKCMKTYPCDMFEKTIQLLSEKMEKLK